MFPHQWCYVLNQHVASAGDFSSPPSCTTPKCVPGQRYKGVFSRAELKVLKNPTSLKLFVAKIYYFVLGENRIDLPPASRFDDLYLLCHLTSSECLFWHKPFFSWLHLHFRVSHVLTNASLFLKICTPSWQTKPTTSFLLSLPRFYTTYLQAVGLSTHSLVVSTQSGSLEHCVSF